MGKRPESIGAVRELIFNFDNLVIDADAIQRYNFHGKNILLTPHGGELSNLGVKSSKDQLIQFSLESDVTLLFKGKIDYITNGIYFKKNFTGHPRMAVGGTGDLLAGICGGLMARGLTAFEAARLGSYVTGLAGEMSFEEYGSGFLPSELALCVSKIFGKI
jgi:NAD(P)H-hydrate epimerase